MFESFSSAISSCRNPCNFSWEDILPANRGKSFDVFSNHMGECENCKNRFSFLRRKKICCTCCLEYCNSCLKRLNRTNLQCNKCNILSRWPIKRDDIASLPVRDLQHFLNTSKISTQTIKEKDELIDLTIVQLEVTHLRNRSQQHYSTTTRDDGIRVRPAVIESDALPQPSCSATNNLLNNRIQTEDYNSGIRVFPSSGSEYGATSSNHSEPLEVFSHSAFDNIESSDSSSNYPRGTSNNVTNQTVIPMSLGTPINDFFNDFTLPGQNNSTDFQPCAAETGYIFMSQDCDSVRIPLSPHDDSQITDHFFENSNHLNDFKQSSSNPIQADATMSPDSKSTIPVEQESLILDSDEHFLSNSENLSPCDIQNEANLVSQSVINLGSESDLNIRAEPYENSNPEANILEEAEQQSQPENPVNENFANVEGAIGTSEADEVNGSKTDEKVDVSNSMPNTPLLFERKNFATNQELVHLKSLKSEDDIKKLSVRQCKILLSLHRVDYSGICEKHEILAKVRLLWYDYQENIKDKNKLPEDQLCKVCMDAPMDCVFLECGHIVCCTFCGKQMNECPVCRQNVVRIVKTFKA